ncbi:hypothetical protein TNCV_4259721 [Trichonephila clavipes]|nr:hypothetical protein TNCV_4259721 [Trichonephila clavipes]
MKRAIWATYFHKASIDAYPHHGMCPTNEDTWCEYNRAITTVEVSKHKNPLPSEVFNYIKNVCTGSYQQLTSLPNAYLGHEQMSRFGGLSEQRPSVFKTRSKFGTHLSTQCSGDERQSRPCAAR